MGTQSHVVITGKGHVNGTIWGFKLDDGTKYKAQKAATGAFHYVRYGEINPDGISPFPITQPEIKQGDPIHLFDSSGECNKMWQFAYEPNINSFTGYRNAQTDVVGLEVGKCKTLAELKERATLVLASMEESELLKTAQNNKAIDEAYDKNYRIHDFAGVMDKAKKQEILSKLSTSLLQGMELHYVLTDQDTSESLLQRFLKTEPDSGTYIKWIHFTENGEILIIDIVPSNFKERMELAMKHWTQIWWAEVALNTNKATRDTLFLFMLQMDQMLEQMTALAQVLTIDEKYWNPNAPDYVKEMEYVVRLQQLMSGNIPTVFLGKKAEIQFAFTVGVYNGLIEELGALAEAGHLFTNYMTDVENARAFDQALDQLSLDVIWQQMKQAHGFEDEASFDEYAFAHQLGKDLVTVVSMFVGIGEISSATKMGALLSKLQKGSDLLDPLSHARKLNAAFDKLIALNLDQVRYISFRKNLLEADVDQALKQQLLQKALDLEDLAPKFITDFAENPQALAKLAEQPGLVDSWNKLSNTTFSDLAKNPVQLEKFDALAKSNNLGLDADGLANLFDAKTATKQLSWENPDGLLDAVKRGSDANIDGVSIKGFPEPADGNTSFVLSNAKQYQKEASGDALLSFDKNGVSFDNVTPDGKLVDRKYGHSSVFNADGSVANRTRSESILDQIERQITANGGNASGIRWEISSEGGANGIEQLFLDNPRNFPGLEDVEVIHVPQQTIITN